MPTPALRHTSGSLCNSGPQTIQGSSVGTVGCPWLDFQGRNWEKLPHARKIIETWGLADFVKLACSFIGFFSAPERSMELQVRNDYGSTQSASHPYDTLSSWWICRYPTPPLIRSSPIQHFGLVDKAEVCYFSYAEEKTCLETKHYIWFYQEHTEKGTHSGHQPCSPPHHTVWMAMTCSSQDRL